MNIKDLIKKPSIIGICGDVHTGKSNLIYHIIDEFKTVGNFDMYAFGLKSDVKNLNKIKGVEELERIENSVIIIDEMFSLFNLENSKEKGKIEKCLRLINHRNNIVILVGLGDNFKKFISAKLHYIMMKKVSFDNLINGSSVKKAILNYKGDEVGSTLLNLEKDEMILYDCDSHHFTDIIKIPYLEKYDSKKQNEPIVKIFPKKSQEKKVQKNIQKKSSEKSANYKEGYKIMQDYFDCIPEEERTKVDKQLKKVGL